MPLWGCELGIVHTFPGRWLFLIRFIREIRGPYILQKLALIVPLGVFFVVNEEVRRLPSSRLREHVSFIREISVIRGSLHDGHKKHKKSQRVFFVSLRVFCG